MKSIKSISSVVFITTLMLGSTSEAQQSPAAVPSVIYGPASEQDILFFTQKLPDPLSGSSAAVSGVRVFEKEFSFMSAMDPGMGNAITGAPYSADAVTETIQILSDGNRIVRKVTSRTARDREGRTRRDQNLEAIVPRVATESAPQVSFITDPVSRVQLILEHATRTARQVPLGDVGTFAAAKSVVASPGDAFEVEVAPAPHGVVSKRIFIGNGEATYEPRSESLGKQFIEGVEAEGTRVVTTIPAGAIGNERAIDIIAETWYVPSLQLVVLSRNTDPRFGETTYRLENLSLVDPVSSTFEVPRDYTIAAPPNGPVIREFRKLDVPQR